MKLVAFLAACAVLACAQRHKLGEINTETEEGKVLQAIGSEEDAGRKLQLMESFVSKYGKHAAAGWVWSQLQPAYNKAGNFDKAVQAGEQLFAIDAGDMDAAYGSLKASEGKKDAPGVLKWAVTTSDLARKTATAPKREDQTDEEYKQAVDFAKQVDTYTEYSLYATGLAEPNPQNVVQLAHALEARNPNSQYLPQVMSRYAWAAREAKVMPEAVAFGERAFARKQFNEDLLAAMADYYLNANPKQPEKVLEFSGKLVEVISSKPRPEGVSEADWAKKKSLMLGLGHWMAGSTYGSQSKHALTDKSFRSALPYIKDNDQLLAGALFHLGVANYQIGKGKNTQQMVEAVNFMKQCAALKSPYQAKAQQNLAVMRKETGGK
ncbi:MAG TPA: hypothetical protein VES20_14455 [Bryobacteraceae bacterium]|nr:hypothetical protein [Bryobacteraceae bacterium]